jgi:hypothetical protein
MTKEVTIKIKVKPFTVPNFVVREVVARPRQEGVKFDDSGIPLSDLDAYTLEEMCEEFTNAVFAKAGKQRPPQLR